LSGIGNAYSDEILHAAQLSPILQTQKMTGEHWNRLYAATRETLKLWMDRLGTEAKKDFPEKGTAFRPEMATHGKLGKPFTRCDQKVQRTRYADKPTNSCAKCQPGGKPLAHRSLSPLPGAD